MKAQRVTIHTLRQMKEKGEKIAVLTAYDATFARLFDEARPKVRAWEAAHKTALGANSRPSEHIRTFLINQFQPVCSP